MNLLVVLHEATRTGAPRVGGLIAAALRQHFGVRVLCLRDGPLMEWLKARIGADRVGLLASAEPRHRTPFAERLRAAQEALRDDESDLVYVNSAAASEFVVAAKQAGRRVVLNLHENAQMLRRMLEIDLVKFEALLLCDGVVLAAGGQRRDLAEVFGFVPERCLDFGIAIDAQEIASLARSGAAIARNAAGDAIAWGERLAIGMCGHADPRKGADIFFAAAAALPQHDFVWVGDWGRENAPDNPAFDRFIEARLPNFYVTGGVDNPYQYIARFDLFFLSSREDPNPVVLAEALTLGVPILAFSRTTAVTDFLGRSAIVCHGSPNLPDAARVLRALDASELRSPQFRGLSQAHRPRFDIAQKAEGLAGFLANV